MTAVGALIRPALPGEGPVIYSLKQRIFPPELLLTSIYADPRVVHYIEDTLSAQDSDLFHMLFLADSTAAGYFHAVRHSTELFLDYVGVRPEYQGRGLGNLLLDAFEALGDQLHSCTLSLDVDEAHPIAVAWYRRRGFREVGGQDTLVLRRQQVPVSPQTTQCHSADWDAALKQLERYGFSKLRLWVDDQSFVVGLLGADRLKLLKPGIVDLDCVVDAVAGLWPQRPYLIVQGPAANVPSTCSLISHTTTIRMSRPVT